MCNLHNKKVKINADRVLNRKDKLSPLFVNFVNYNKDKTFTAMLEKNYTEMYILEEEPVWLFYKDDLIAE